MFCNHCGSPMPDGAAFCSSCGAAATQTGQQVFQGYAYAPQQAPVEKYKVMEDVTSRLNAFAGGEGAVKLRLRDFFDSVFKKHTREEAEDIFICGTGKTTPPIEDVSAEWPHPWLYSRVFAVLFLTFFGCVVLGFELQNLNAFPGIMFVGAMVVPFSMLIFLFETNAPRNINIADIVKIFFVGGISSILLIYPLSEILPGGGTTLIIPSMITGITEEVAKILITAFFLSRVRGRGYILNGLLIGAAVGAGFAVFESAGYAFQQIVDGSPSDMLSNIVLRAVLSIGGHTAWAAVEGAAMGLCEKDGAFVWKILIDKRFLVFAGSMIVLHGIWDMYVLFLDDLLLAKHVILIAAVWVFLIVLLNRGLEQINELSASPAKEEQGDSVSHSVENNHCAQATVAETGIFPQPSKTCCPKCGAQRLSGASFCPQCGSPFDRS